MMTRLLGAIFVSSLAGCGEDVIRQDIAFAKDLKDKHFPQGASYESVRSFFHGYGRSIELSRECTLDFERCPYLAIETIPAPGNHWWLEKGAIQIYLTFNQNKELTSQFYEIYYPANHR